MVKAKPLNATKCEDRMESPRQVELRQAVLDCGAVRHGHFLLASGRHSDVYVEKFRILERPRVLERVSREIVEHFRALKPDVVAGPSTGGMIVAYEVARQLDVQAVYVEADGAKRVLKRGGRIEQAARVLLVDDVLTTGSSLTDVLEVIRDAQAVLVGVGVLIDRSEERIDFGVDLHAACRFEAATYAADEVPDWLERIPVSTPGTRAKRSAPAGA